MVRWTLAALLLGTTACTTAEPVGGCIDVVPGPPDVAGWITVNGKPALLGDASWDDRQYPGRARWQRLQTRATVRCTDGDCAVLDEAVSDKDCPEDACWRHGEAAADYNVGTLAVHHARRSGLVPAQGTVEIRVGFRTTGPIKPPRPCPY